MASLDYSAQLKNLVNAQKKAQTAELQNTRNQALSNLEAERAQNAANYATQRSTANAQNRLSARNFQEYLANTGRANSGLGAQAEMQYNNNLNTSLSNIYSAENAANADILKRQTDANNAYNTGLAKANAEIQANYIQALLDEKSKAWERAMQEKEYKENVRQFNENLKLQKQQLQQRFSSGSGGGSYSYYKSGNNGSKEPIGWKGKDPESKKPTKDNGSKSKGKDSKNNKKNSVSKIGLLNIRNPYQIAQSIINKGVKAVTKAASKNSNKNKKLSNFYSLKPKKNTGVQVTEDQLKLLNAKKKK